MCKSSPISSNVKILSFNVEGLSSELEDPNFVDMLYEHDICLLNETWRPNDSKLDLPNFWDFSIVRPKHKKVGRHSGGVTVLCKEELRSGVKISSCSEGFIWIKLDPIFFNLNNPLFICATYIPPEYASRNANMKTNYFQVLTDSLVEYSNKGHILIAGDLNARQGKDILSQQSEIKCIEHLLPSDLPSLALRSSSDHITNNYGRKLDNLCKTFNLVIANGRTPGDRLGNFTCHTNRGNSVVDYLISDQSLFQQISRLNILPPEFGSVHCPLSLILNCQFKKCNPTKKAPLPHPPKLIWDANKLNSFNMLTSQPAFLNNFSNLKTKLENSCTIVETDNTLKAMSDALYDTASNCFKLAKRLKRQYKPKPKPWFTPTCQAAKKRLHNLAKLLNKSPKDPYIRGKFISVKKEYRNTLRQHKRNFETANLDQLQGLTSQPKQFWNLLKKINSGKDLGSSNLVQPDTWVDHFSSLNKKDPSLSHKNFDHCQRIRREINDLFRNNSSRTPCPILDRLFTEAEVLYGIKRLKKGKASALDGISNDIIKASAHLIAPIVTLAFNNLITLSHFPIQWCTGLIIPLHKSGDTSDPNNFRGITLNSCLSKLFTLLLNDRLMTFCETNKLINDSQIGFRKGFRTSDHVFTLKTIIDQTFQKKKKLYTCFVDFRKAYDTVWRDGLFVKLLKGGVSTQFTRLIQDMYSRLQASVHLPSGISFPFPSTVGLKQGCNLSPILFNIFINNLSNIINNIDNDAPFLRHTKVGCLLYADDLVLMSESKEGLQASLDRLYEFTNTWFLEVNPTKTKCMIFSRGRRGVCNNNFKLGDTHIQMCDSYCYLGVIFTYTGSFKTASKALNDKAYGAMFPLLRNIYKYQSMNLYTMHNLFDRMILPIALYNCEIWGTNFLPLNSRNDDFFSINHLSKHMSEILHFRFLKRILSVPQRTSNWAVITETGKYPVIIKVFSLMIKYFKHLMNAQSSILKDALITNIELSNRGYNSWFRNIARILKFTNMECILQNDGAAHLPHLKEKLQVLYRNKWVGERESFFTDSKLDFLVSLKNELNVSPHLLVSKVPVFKAAITQVRTSAHKFPIETGRYSQTPRLERTCPFGCHTLGDECHYLFDCKHPLIERARIPILNDISCLKPEVSQMDPLDKCKFLLTSEDPQTVHLIGKLCYDIQKIFKVLSF